MATVTEKLQELKDTKERIKVAIESKGQDLTNVPFTQYPEKVAEIRPNVISKEIVENGTYNAEDDGVEGYSSVNVNVPVPDLSSTTATSEDVFQGKQFYNAQGELVAGTYKDMMQRKVDITKSCYNLFSSIQDEDISWTSKLDTTGVTDMSYMFYNCTKIQNLNVDNLDTSNVTTMKRMFNNCNHLLYLNLDNFDTSNVTDMGTMFYQCQELLSLDLSNFNTKKVTNMGDMIGYCNKLHTLNVEGWDTSNVTTMSYMFYQCSKIESIVGTLDMISVINTSDMFYNCKQLRNITLKNIKTNLSLISSNYLSNEILVSIIQELHDLTGSSSKKLTLSTTSKNNIANIYVKLIDVTDEMRAEDEYIDNKKPCVVCESTDAGAMTLTEYAMSKNWAIA